MFTILLIVIVAGGYAAFVSLSRKVDSLRSSMSILSNRFNDATARVQKSLDSIENKLANPGTEDVLTEQMVSDQENLATRVEAVDAKIPAANDGSVPNP